MTPIRACLLTASLAAVAAAGVAQAQTATAPAKPADSSLTWNGITLYGIVDIGLQFETHGVPSSDYFPAGTESIIQKNSNGSITAVTPNNWSQSRIGLSGNEPLVGDWAGVFRLETFFNPQAGTISDALKSLVLNNGRANNAQSTNVDSSVAGQLFAGAAYAGFSSKSLGTITFGRHVTPLSDGIAKYDPMGASQAFSLIGFSGTAAGGGSTEDRRLDQSLKYSGKFDWMHLGALYQFSGSSGSTNTAVQVTVGGDFGPASVDLYYAKKYDAVAAAPLSTAQLGQLTNPTTGICPTSQTPPPNPNGPSCFSPSNSLAATVSDNTTFSIMGLLSLDPLKLYGGYEHVKFANPVSPFAPGTIIIGGYQLAFVNNTAYTSNKTLNVYWAGFKYTMTPSFDLLGAYYGYHQGAFATGALAGCSKNVSNACSGTEHALSLVGDYRLSKRFDLYAGTFYTVVKDGLAAPQGTAANGFNGFLQTNNLATTAGVRFRF